MADDALVQDLLGAVKAYAEHYGVPESAEQLQGLVTSLLRLKAQVQAIEDRPLEPVLSVVARQLGRPVQDVEALIGQVASAFQSGNWAAWISSTVHQALAEQTHQWQQALESQVKEALGAYVQQVVPGPLLADLRNLAEAVVPLVYDGAITRAEVVALAQKVASTFGLEGLLAQVINPRALAVAQELAVCMAQKPLEDAVQETVVAYLEKYQTVAEAVSEELIENAIAAITHLPIEFDWATELNLKDKRLLIKQVAFKLNILKASPVPSKAAREIADQVQTEVERFRQERERALGAVDVTQGLGKPGNLEVSSSWNLPHPPS